MTTERIDGPGIVPAALPTNPAKLHRYHCAQAATRLEVALPDAAMTWRADGRYPLAMKQAIALRLATCWNVLEGMPTEALADGILRDLFCAVDAGDIAAAQAIVKRFDARADLTDGRAHDCKSCLGEDV